MSFLDRYLFESRYWVVRLIYEGGEEGHEEPWRAWMIYKAAIGRKIIGMRIYYGQMIYEGYFNFPFHHPMYFKSIEGKPSDVWVWDLMVEERGEAIRLCTQNLFYNGIKIQNLLGLDQPWQSQPFLVPKSKCRDIDEMDHGLTGEIRGFICYPLTGIFK